MKYSEIKGRPSEELKKMLEEFKIKLGEMRFQLSGNALKNTSEIKRVKRNIAKILTLLKSNSQS